MIAIIGAGPLGRWLALSAARAGFRVMLEDVMPTNLRHSQELLRRQLSPHRGESSAVSGTSPAQRVDPPEPELDSALSKITFVSSIEDAVRDADLVIDCVPDELESKLEILWLLDRMAPPRTVLATPTTRLSIVDLASCTYRPEKCVAIVSEASALPTNPNAEVRLRTTAQTAPETMALIREFWEALGLNPVFAPESAPTRQ